jgi:hypothetical protein
VVLLSTTCGAGDGLPGTEARTNITALLVTLPIALIAYTLTLIFLPVKELANVTS